MKNNTQVDTHEANETIEGREVVCTKEILFGDIRFKINFNVGDTALIISVDKMEYGTVYGLSHNDGQLITYWGDSSFALKWALVP